MSSGLVNSDDGVFGPPECLRRGDRNLTVPTEAWKPIHIRMTKQAMHRFTNFR